MNLNKKVIVSYLYVFLLIAYSGNPVFSISGDTGQYIFTGLIIILVIKHIEFFKPNEGKFFYFFIGTFIIAYIFQSLILEFISIISALGFLLKITLGYIVIRYVGVFFKWVYFDLIFFIALVSLIGFFINNIGYNIPAIVFEESNTKLIDNSLRSILIFNQKGDGLRNSGMFWEPGAFACYINVAFILFLGNIKDLLRLQRFKFIVIVIALLTTFSTTGYIVFFLLLICTIFIESSSNFKVFVVPLTLGLAITGYYFFEKTEFLGEKIRDQFEKSQNLDGEFSNTRFGALMFDLYYIEKNPLFGNGYHVKTRFADHPWLQEEESLGHGNGFSNFLASMGIFTMFIYLYYLVKFNERNKWLVLLFILLLLQGEPLLNYPLFLTLPFIFIYGKHRCNFNLS